ETSSVLRGSQTPCAVHRWIASSDFPPRPVAPPPRAVTGSQGLPVLAHDASTLARGLGVRPRQVPLRLASLGASGVAFGSGNSLGTWKLDSISRLNTRPACAPVNASVTPSQADHMTRGRRGLASPSTCESLLRCIMPVYPGASPGASELK